MCYHLGLSLDSVDCDLFCYLLAPLAFIRNFRYVHPYEMSESLLAASRYNFCILRPSLIYGHKVDRNIRRLYEALQCSRPVFLPGGELFSPHIIEDVAHAITHALRRYLSGSSSRAFIL